MPDYYLKEMTEEPTAAETPASTDVNSKKYSESFKVKYKTEMCKNWENTGHCEFEDSCSFAHGADELKIKTDVPKNYKTKLCKRYHKQMYCPYGARCQFLHGEVQDKPMLSETVAATSSEQTKKKKQVSKRQSTAKVLESDLYSELKKVNLARPLNGRLSIFEKITEPTGLNCWMATINHII